MKINEIQKFKEIFPDRFKINSCSGYASEKRIIESYQDEGEVVAYRQSFMGLVFLFKGTIDFFAFRILCIIPSPPIYIFISRLGLGVVKKAFEENKGKEDLVIVNGELYKKFNASIILKGLKGEQK